MDRRIEELVKATKDKFGLENYYLQRHSLARDLNVLNETNYTFCMEWFPNHVTVEEEDDLNPDGTAVIEFDVTSRKYNSVSFVMGQTYAKNGVAFKNKDKNDIIKWIENETGLTYQKHFKLSKEEEGELCFQACYKEIAVAPAGYIKVTYNQEGKLISFSKFGLFPSNEIVEDANYTLSLESVEPLAKDQLKLVEFPSFKEKKLISVYAIEEIYVMNDRSSTIPFDLHVEVGTQVNIDETIDWEEPIYNKRVERTEISMTEDITVEQAFSNEPSPLSLPITELEQKQCLTTVKNVLRQDFSSDTGKWKVETLHRDKGYIIATLRANEQELRVFKRKLLIFIDANTLQPVNYIDNKLMLEEFDQFQASDPIKLTKEEAFEKVKEFIELKPYYVYDVGQKRYVLCGKLDCQMAVNSGNGDVISLHDL
ncbi:hypothetical protein [Bacillus sp. JCM 19034]|uniref:hypothetical protein n=1 Tax=Bacillus sp. JCM 19034 TaxID=1481928 RepID=UPI0007867C5F|nr:hypothetical protein [Bacillus sp. JCM 19034]